MTTYTSVTLSPPATFSANTFFFGGTEIIPSSGQYLFDSTSRPLTNEKLATLLSQGWAISSLTP